ncbi:class I SAM-dependent methyltransferase [Streptomyces sp. NPDC005574]|uniref:class I SAM-dependent methyltransferase n=1 Tax=Streptomyces sp. NPDC005574 TaxID=3156891 RepID=UPI0033B92CD1
MSAPSAPSAPPASSGDPAPPAPTAPPEPAAECGPRLPPVYEPRRADCPWCASKRLRGPGALPVDECRDCGHLFQNPRLTVGSLAARLGDAGEGWSAVRRHRSAARAMLSFPEPEGWLDVGAGRAHFAAVAKELFPYTSFDGLDPTPRVEAARAAGRLEEAYVGPLTDPHLVARLRGRYDVVSMFQHLQRAPDPREELRAALAVLRPGGHLLLELLDPHSVPATVLRPWWLARTQPRAVHLIPPANLRAVLEAQGCTVVTPGRRARLAQVHRLVVRKATRTTRAVPVRVPADPPASPAAPDSPS